MIITYMPNYVRIEDFNNTLHKNDKKSKVSFPPQIHM